VIVKDASGCTANGSVTITSSSSIGVTIEAKNVTCNAGTDGGLVAMVSGGSAPYTYSWNNGGAIAVQANVPAGTYTVTVKDAAGCTGTDTKTITQPSAIVITPTAGSTSCGSSNGTITTVTTGGNGEYTYLWSNGGTTPNLSNLAAGSYTLTLTDSKGCKAYATATVTSSNGISLSAGSTSTTCYGGTNGSASATVTGSTGTVTYAWSNGGNTATITNLAAGTYTVTATNGSCVSTKDVIVGQPTVIAIAISNLTNPTCNANNGSITASASGGTPGYSYVWSNGATTASISGLSAGTYTVTVTDANGCTKMTSPAVSAPNGPSVSLNAKTDVSCFGGSNGTAAVTVSGGATPYFYNWGASRTTASVTGLVAGSYTVTVTDANNCTAQLPVTITQPAAITLSFATTSASCQPTGSATVTPSGGTGAYTYLWSNGATTNKITNVAGGSYTVTVIDQNNCSVNGPVTVPGTASPNFKCDVTLTKPMSEQNSNDAEAKVVGSLGTAPYTYLWSNGATSQSIAGLSATTYRVTVTDANGCTSNCFITVPNSLCSNVTNPGTICCSQTICAPGELQPLNETLPASGGSADPIEYLWMYNNASGTFNAASWTTITGATGKDLPVNLMPAIDKVTYIIRCVRRGNCGNYKESNVITITPRAFANIQGPRTACVNQDVTFTADENTAGASYYWNYQGANISTSFNRVQTIRFNSIGPKEVRLTVNAFGCQKTILISVNVTTCLGAYGGFNGFNANPLNQKEVVLEWTTSNEAAESRYIVEKSTDAIAYTRIGEVASQNRTNNLYKFSDVAPKMGRSFYRVRQVTIDSKDINATDSKKVMMSQNGQTVLTYPNPAQSSIFVEVLDADNAEGTIQIYNHIGRLVQTQQFTKDQLRYQINTENLASGTYILKIHRNDGNVQSVKITKL
jgi:hypothetical protein